MPYKRTRSAPYRRKTNYAARAKTAARKGRTGYANVLRSKTNRIGAQVSRLTRMIETKESRNCGLVNIGLPHNNVYLVTANPFLLSNGTGDPMSGTGERIGDEVNVQGMSATFFLEAAVGRSRVYFRVMLLKGAKGETFDRSTIFKGASGNKMIDEVNTERFTIIAQKIITVMPPNAVASNFSVLTGVPSAATPAGITGSRILKFWIPGKRFGKGGRIHYESQSTQVKFYDYRWCLLAYDWYGTPQDTNNVGIINESFTRLYYKDA